MFQLFKQNKMYRILLIYQFFSSIGGGMFSIFILLSVHLIYNNPVYTGIAGFLMAAPRIFSFAVGPIVDRCNKVTIMRLSTFLEFLVLSILVYAPLQDTFGVLFMFGVIFIYNVAALFEVPAGTALLPKIVPEDKIVEGNSLINISSMTGGLIIATVLFTTFGDINFRFLFGFSAVFLGITFIFSLLLRNAEATTKNMLTSPINYISDLKEGAKFIRRNIILYTTIAAVVMGMFGEIAQVNRPSLLEYYVGVHGYVVFSIVGLVGGIAASYFVGMLGSKFKLGRLLFALFMLASMVRILFVIFLPVLFVGGLATLTLYSALTASLGILFLSLNQKIPPENMVGRVDTMARTFGAIFVAIGALAGGFLGSIVSVVDHIFLFQGASYILVGALMVSIPSIRRLPRVNEILRQ